MRRAAIAALAGLPLASRAMAANSADEGRQAAALLRAEFVDATGGLHRLSELTRPLLLVDLWAAWCSGCIEELPTIDRLARQLGAESIDVVLISHEMNWQDDTAFARKNRLPFRFWRLSPHSAALTEAAFRMESDPVWAAAIPGLRRPGSDSGSVRAWVAGLVRAAAAPACPCLAGRGKLTHQQQYGHAADEHREGAGFGNRGIRRRGIGRRIGRGRLGRVIRFGREGRQHVGCFKHTGRDRRGRFGPVGLQKAGLAKRRPGRKGRCRLHVAGGRSRHWRRACRDRREQTTTRNRYRCCLADKFDPCAGRTSDGVSHTTGDVMRAAANKVSQRMRRMSQAARGRGGGLVHNSPAGV